MTLLKRDALPSDAHLESNRHRAAADAPDDEGLLLVSYQFPPLGGVGVQRALAMAKFFPECGYRVHVLTPRNGVSHTYDPALLEELPEGVTVHRSLTPEVPFTLRRRIWQMVSGAKPRANAPAAQSQDRPAAPQRPRKRQWVARMARRLIFPDPQFGWGWTAARKAIHVIRRQRISTVVVTAPPFSSLGLIPAIKKACPHVTVVADFRDEWLEYYLKQIAFVKDDSLKDRAYQFQRAAIEAADLVVAVTRSSLDKLMRQSPGEPAWKFQLIPNGYDDTKVFPLKSAQRTEGPIRVVYLGTVYKPCTPRTYMAALERLPESVRSRFETTFVGRVDDGEMRFLTGTSAKVQVLGFLPQNEAIRRMEQADYLLLPLTEPSVLPGKIYEYLGTEKPILALTPANGELGRLMEETRAGHSVEHHDIDRIAQLLESLAGGTAPVVSAAVSRTRYSRRNLTAEYARLIRRVQATAAEQPRVPDLLAEPAQGLAAGD